VLYAGAALPDLLVMHYKFLNSSLFSLNPVDPLNFPLPGVPGIQLRHFQVEFFIQTGGILLVS
jgi:hypothetical protein